MKRLTHTFFIASFFTLIVFETTNAQNWQALGQGPGFTPRVMIVDTIKDLLYMPGYNVNKNAVMAWDGQKWDTLFTGIYQSYIYSLAMYKNQLLAGGFFDLVDSLGNFYPECYLIKWTGTRWVPFESSKFSSVVVGLVTQDSVLYALGSFDSINNLPVQKMAKFDGYEWSNIGNFNQSYEGGAVMESAFGGAFYQNEFYLSANYTDSTGHTQRIAKFNGSEWSNVGEGIRGIQSGVSSFSIYQNELYIGGLFTINDGNNPGNYMAKWNGTAWSQVGDGMAGTNMVGNGQVHGLLVYDGNLYAMGVFSYAGGVPAIYIAKWNGSQWCGFGDTFDNRILCAAEFQNELYIGGGFKIINGDSVVEAAKWVGGDFVDTCSKPVAIEEIYTRDFNLSVFPNPTSTTITLSLPSNQNAMLSIFNLLGEKVKEEKVTGREVTMDVSSLPQGLYLVRTENRVVGKFVKE